MMLWMPTATNLHRLKSPNGNAKRSTQLAQILEMQDGLIVELRKKLKPADRSALARAWCDLQMERRLLKKGKEERVPASSVPRNSIASAGDFEEHHTLASDDAKPTRDPADPAATTSPPQPDTK